MENNNRIIWSNWDDELDDPDMLAEYLEDERANLNVKLGAPIIVIADLGLWNGRRKGYKMINSGNIKDCLYDDCDYITWYCDRYNFRAVACHHDGVNRYLYRELRENLTFAQRENFLYKLVHNEANERMIRRYTKSIRPEIAKVYGW